MSDVGGHTGDGCSACIRDNNLTTRGGNCSQLHEEREDRYRVYPHLDPATEKEIQKAERGRKDTIYHVILNEWLEYLKVKRSEMEGNLVSYIYAWQFMEGV